MKLSVLLFLAVCITHCLQGQVVTSIVWEKNSFTPYRSDLYYMAENNVRLMIEGVMCDEYEVIYNEGEIRKEKCDLVIIPKTRSEEPGLLVTHVILKYRGKLDTLNFVVQQAPAGDIEIPECGSHSYCSPHKFRQLSVRPSYGITFTLQKFSVRVYRCGEVIYDATNIGTQFTEADRAMFQQLIRKDKIVIEEATILGSDKLERTVRDGWVWYLP